MLTVGKIHVHGHRGWRGHYPENSVIGFTEAVKLGVDVLEMDVVLSSDHQLIVSHDPFMHHEICTRPDGSEIMASEEETFNLYHMNVSEIQRYIIGQKNHPRFPEQQLIASHKPTLREVVDAVQPLLTDHQRQSIHWNIEIKSRPEWDEVFHPNPNVYASIAYEELKHTGILDFAVIQSFDARILTALHQIDPALKLVFLTEEKSFRTDQLIALLGFKPYGFSPYFPFVDQKMVEWCSHENIQLITWTVNEEKDIRHMIELGVTEIISDYPERVIRLISEKE